MPNSVNLVLSALLYQQFSLCQILSTLFPLCNPLYLILSALFFLPWSLCSSLSLIPSQSHPICRCPQYLVLMTLFSIPTVYICGNSNPDDYCPSSLRSDDFENNNADRVREPNPKTIGSELFGTNCRVYANGGRWRRAVDNALAWQGVRNSECQIRPKADSFWRGGAVSFRNAICFMPSISVAQM